MDKKSTLFSQIKIFVEKTFTAKKLSFPSNIEIARQFKKSSKSTLSVDYLRTEVRKALAEGEQIKVNTEKNVPYEIVNDHYFWITKDERQILIPVEKVDQLFYHYSKHGLDWSQTQMINKFNLKPWEWNSLKSRLMLGKLSNIFSPYTVEITPKDELKAMIDEKINQALNQTGSLVEQSYEKNLLRKYKSEVQRYAQTTNIVNTIITELADLLPQADIKIELKRTGNEEGKIVTVHIADIHFGAESRREDLPEYSPEITKRYLDAIAEQVNKLNAKEVHLFFEGDSIETFSGMNHPDAWKGIAKGYYGSRLVLECYKAFAEFISKVNNVKAVYSVSGNHDRAASDKKIESEGYIGEIIFEFIRLSFKNEIEVFYDEKLISKEIDGIQYLMSHGDKKFTDLPPAELILEYGKQGIYNLLTSGHWHERKIKKDSKNFRQIACPSLFPGNDYSVNLGYSSAPGFLITYNNGKNKPTIIDYIL